MRLVLILTPFLFAVLAGAVAVLANQGPEVSTVKTVTANGVALAYVEAGAGEPVVLVHGSLVDYRYSLPLMQRLAAHFHVINYSRRYHVPNPCPRGAAYSEELHAADLAALIRELHLAPAHIVAHSSGGGIAVRMAQQHPDLARSLTLVDPGIYSLLPGNDRGVQVRQEIALAGARAREALAHDLDEEAIRQLMDLVFRPRGYADLAPQTRAMLLENAPSLRAAVVTSAPPPFTCEDAKSLRVPVLLLGGEKSAPEFGMVNDELARCLPNARRATIPGADHNLFNAAAAPIAAEIAKLAARVSQ